MSYERIIGVAVRHRGEVYGLPAPARHGQVLRLIAACMPDDPDAAILCEQGFITNYCTFVTREEARKIVAHEMKRTTSPRLDHYPRLTDHTKPGIVRMFPPQPSAHPTQIFSEDLW